MRDEERQAQGSDADLEPLADDNAGLSPEEDTESPEDADAFEESITEEIAALIDDGRTYAEAELAFQKTRAAVAGRNIGMAILLVVIALIVLNIALIALAVGAVLALEPYVTIWGAIGIVVGVLLVAVAVLGFMAKGRIDTLGVLFGSDKSAGKSE